MTKNMHLQIIGTLKRRLRLLLIYLTTEFSYPVLISEVLREIFVPPHYMQIKDHIERIREDKNYFQIKIRSIDRLVYWPKNYSLDGFFVVASQMLNKNNWHYYQSSNTAVSKGDVIVDCGASEGLFTILNEKNIKKSYLFEPSKYFNLALKNTFAKKSNKIKIIRCALSDSTKMLDFEDNSIIGKVRDDAKSNNMKEVNISDYFHKKNIKINYIPEKIKAITIDDYFYKKNIKIDYIKADLEGWEENVLSGAKKTIKKYRPKIAITSYHVGNDYRKMIQLILDIEPKYQYKISGFSEFTKQPIMLHFWI